MADDRIENVESTSGSRQVEQTEKQEASERLEGRLAQQVASKESLQDAREDALFPKPQGFKTLKEKMAEKMQKQPPTAKPEKDSSKSSLEKTPGAEQLAEAFEKKNPELTKSKLLVLLPQIKEEVPDDEILDLLKRVFQDESLMDEAVDYLIRVAENKEEVKQKLVNIKERFNASKGREIRAGRNIINQSQTFSKQGLGKPTALRNLYREVTDKQQTPNKLFDSLMKQFDFSKMKNIIDFLLHSLGDDMKSKGPSITRAQLQRLMTDTRSMQAILGVFRFFFQRMSHIKKEFKRRNMGLPSHLTFEMLGRILMKLLEDRYPSSQKILGFNYEIGITYEVLAQVVVYSQFRDAMRHISPNLFKSERHRKELLQVLIATLSDLEDEIDEDEEEKNKDG